MDSENDPTAPANADTVIGDTLPQTPPPRGAAIGRTIGRYELRKLLGTGGMGQVYEAYDPKLERAVAVKLLRDELAGALADRFVRESTLMAKIAHPSVVTVYDAGRDGDTVYLAMELIRGQTLTKHLAERRLPWREVVALFERAGQGLAAAHRAGIVHRDFKPDNVLVEGDARRVIVTDFGIARPFDASRISRPVIAGPLTTTADLRLTEPGTMLGTPAYMAPEQLEGDDADVRSDVFSFAVSLWEALFGERPFSGRTLEEIKDAMARTPKASATVPRRLVRALRRALAIERKQRWPDMPSLLRELASVRARRRRILLAVGAVGLVSAGVAGALVLARSAKPDVCADRLARFEHGHYWSAVAKGLVADPAARDAVLAKLGTVAVAWRATHAATCHASGEPAQAPDVSACLEARRIELAGVAADIELDGPTDATKLVELVGSPAACAHPTPSMAMARIPEAPALRRSVTAARHRAFAAQSSRDYAAAVAAETKLVADAGELWPPLRAELLYLLGATQIRNGDVKPAEKTLHDAVAAAEAAHDDDAAARAWLELSMSATNDVGDPARGVEYAKYAEAASDRLGHPPDIACLVAYARGLALVASGNQKDGEAALRQAVDIAEAGAPQRIAQSIQGLGYFYEDQGRIPEAIEAYRSALAHLPPSEASAGRSAVVFRDGLAANLSMSGDSEHAEVAAREAVAIADRSLGADSLDRAIAHATLAQVLEEAGKSAEALTEAERVVRDVARIEGDRNERYGEALVVQATILVDLKRPADAEKLFERACDIVAFAVGPDSIQEAECWLKQLTALTPLHKHAEGLELVDKALPIAIKIYGEVHPQVATALQSKGALEAGLGKREAAIADLEHAVQIWNQLNVEPGRLAGAKWELAKVVAWKDRARARQLADEALKLFEGASPVWQSTREEAAAWRAKH